MSEQITKSLLVSGVEAARMMSISPRKLWSMTFEDSPGVPYVRVGKLVRYAVADLERWIEERRIGGGQ